MRITVEDSSMVNWDSVLEKVTEDVQVEAKIVVRRAQDALAQLKPGERKTITVKVGSITVARPK